MVRGNVFWYNKKMDKVEEQNFLEILMEIEPGLSERSKKLAVTILNGHLPQKLEDTKPEYTLEQATFHEQIQALLVKEHGIFTPQNLGLTVKTLRYKMSMKYLKILSEGADIVGGVLQEARQLGVGLPHADEAYRIHLSGLMARYLLRYVSGHQPYNIPFSLPVFINVACPNLEEGSFPQWDDAMNEALPSYLHGTPSVRKLVLERWLDPATPSLIGAEAHPDQAA